MTSYRRATDLMEAELGDELVALDRDAGLCFGFNCVAASVWRALKEPKTFEEIREALLDEYEVEPARCSLELTDLLRQLVANGLVAEAR